MPPISFNVGPSALYPQVRELLLQAHDSGILSASHRSQAFCDAYALAVQQLQYKLEVPKDYTVLFYSSATECWSVLSESMVRYKSLHLYSGSFGQRWFDYAEAIRPHSIGVRFGLDENPAQLIDYARQHLPETELVAITHNETSNGTQVPMRVLPLLRQAVGADVLLAVDGTSSMAGVVYDWAQADVWFASVQKCFGLPAGLGVLILSPRALLRAQDIAYKGQYNALVSAISYARDNQTTHTPNVLLIYLLGQLLQQLPPISSTSAMLNERAQRYYQFFADHSTLRPLITPPELRSTTVIALQCNADTISRAKQQAAQAGYTLGSGYGQWKQQSIRIANFPAIAQADVDGLLQCLASLS